MLSLNFLKGLFVARDFPSLFGPDASLGNLLKYFFGMIYDLISALIPWPWYKVLGVIAVVIGLIVFSEFLTKKEIKALRQKSAGKPPPLPAKGNDASFDEKDDIPRIEKSKKDEGLLRD